MTVIADVLAFLMAWFAWSEIRDARLHAQKQNGLAVTVSLIAAAIYFALALWALAGAA